MIAIVNISPEDTDPFGENEYSLRINTKEIGRFTHTREDPLHVILTKAAVCAEEHEYEKFCTMMDAVEEHDPEYKYGLNKE